MKVKICAPEYDVHDFVIKQDAISPNLDAVLKNQDGDPVDLSGATVRFRMRAADADSRQVDSPATITDAANGEVQYGWSDGDTDTVEHFNAEFAVDYNGGTGNNFDPNEYFPSDDYLIIRVMDHV